MPAEASAPRPAILVVALSARALTRAAVRAGYAPLAADCFGDADTRALAADFRLVSGDVTQGLDAASCRAALAALAGGRTPVGLVYGSGFEGCPEQIGQITPTLPLLGNSPARVRAVKCPIRFAAICAQLGIPHPAIRFEVAPDEGWLEKRIGGAGGTHIRAIPPGHAPRAGHYLQRRVAGKPVSALFLADGRQTRVLFFTAQWADPAPHAPFRYGGAVRPATPAPALAAAMEAAVTRITAASGLVGLNSADFLVRDEDFDLLEINPRPGATLDLAPGPIFRWHLAACRGRLPARAPALSGAMAAAVLYARNPVPVPSHFAWPGWMMDLPEAATIVPPGAPFCTVRAAGRTPEAALALLRRRMKFLLTRMENAP